MNDWSMEEALEHYRSQGAPQDQQMVLMLLREVQEHTGPLTQEDLSRIAQSYGLGRGFLPALIRRIPDLRMSAHPHRLEICRSCARQLGAWIEREYGVGPGGASDRGGFTYHVVGCLKNCKAGPSARWDGELIPHATEAILRQKIDK